MTTRNFPPNARRIGWIALVATLLILPALYNHYPLLYPDTGEYLYSAVTLRPPRVRLVGYGLWILATGGRLTAWAPIVAQSLLLAVLLVRTLAAIGVGRSWRRGLAICVALLLTGAPWMSSELMPDVFAGAVLLAIYLLVAHSTRLGGPTRALAIATVVIGCATHVTIPVVAALVLLLLLLLGLARLPRLELPHAAIVARALALIALSVAALATFNWVRTDRLAVTQTGSVFVLGHLVETGLAERVLARRCGSERFALCPYRDGLTRPIERFIWADASQYYRAYHSEAQLRDDTRHLAFAVLRDEPIGLARSVLSYGVRQFFDVQVFDVARTRPAAPFSAWAVSRVLPNEKRAMLRARQQGEGVGALRYLDAAFLNAMLAALVLSAWMLARALREGSIALDGAAGLQLFVWLALIVNALVCANLSGVFGRYQERIAWLLPVVVAASLARRRAGRAPETARAG